MLCVNCHRVDLDEETYNNRDPVCRNCRKKKAELKRENETRRIK